MCINSNRTRMITKELLKRNITYCFECCSYKQFPLKSTLKKLQLNR